MGWPLPDCAQPLLAPCPSEADGGGGGGGWCRGGAAGAVGAVICVARFASAAAVAAAYCAICFSSFLDSARCSRRIRSSFPLARSITFRSASRFLWWCP